MEEQRSCLNVSRNLKVCVPFFICFFGIFFSSLLLLLSLRIASSNRPIKKLQAPRGKMEYERYYPVSFKGSNIRSNNKRNSTFMTNQSKNVKRFDVNILQHEHIVGGKYFYKSVPPLHRCSNESIFVMNYSLKDNITADKQEIAKVELCQEV